MSATPKANASTSTTTNAANAAKLAANAANAANAAKLVSNAANASPSEKTPWSIIHLVVTVVFSIGFFIFFSLAFTNLSTFLGNNDKWQAIKDQLWRVLPYTLGGSLCLFAIAFIYFKNNANYITYFIMILLCTSITLSYTALYVSALESYKQT